MKIRSALLAAALALALIGCQAEEPTGTDSIPPEPSPTVSAPPEALTLEQLLARQPMDDTHDAFLVDTGGKLGTLLVTVEMGERGPNPDPEWEPWENPVYLSVWNPADMGEPIQRMDAVVDSLMFGEHETVDANFDGRMDFSVLRNRGNGAGYWYLWVWDEEAGQFAEVPEYREISLPRCNPETGIIDGWARNSGGGDGVATFHRWEDRKLVCVRRIETGYDYENGVVKFEVSNEVTYFPSWIKVEERMDGELTQVYYRYYSVDEGTDFFPEREKWENLDYHGED